MKREMAGSRPMAETRPLRVAAANAPDLMLGILETRSERLDRRLPPVLLVHGATLGANLFDLPRAGYSLMSWLASKGRAVYAVDIRGFGTSLGGKVMDAPADAHPPFASAGEAVSDIRAAVDLVLARERVEAVDLVGFSWGTITSARYATENPETVRRLALYAPLYAEVNRPWLDRIADPHDCARLNPSIGSYRLVAKADLVARWNGDLPTDDPSVYREADLPDVVFEVFAALDPRARSSDVPAFRCPSGPLADLVRVFNGRPLYDPRKLSMPTLLVRGSDDTTSTDTDARRLLADVGATEKSYGVIAPGSHFLILEKNRSELYQRFDDFLGPTRS